MFSQDFERREALKVLVSKDSVFSLGKEQVDVKSNFRIHRKGKKQQHGIVRYLWKRLSHAYGREEKGARRRHSFKANQRRSDDQFTVFNDAPEKILCDKASVTSQNQISPFIDMPSIYPDPYYGAKRRIILSSCLVSLHNHTFHKKTKNSNECEL